MKKLIVLACLTLAGCKKAEPDPVPPAPPASAANTVNIEFTNSAGDEELTFGKSYRTHAGDSFTVSKFNYYISNVTFSSPAGRQPVAETYYVVRHPAQRTAVVTGVPNGTYTAMEFMIGVDSVRNCSGAQTGGLDPAVNRDMYWDWNTGYIFLKLEGKAPSSPSGALTYHVGGFKGVNRAMRTVSLSFPATPLIISNSTATMRINADVLEMFRGPEALRFSDYYYQMSPGEGAKKFADNYMDMFTVKSVQN